jgi:transposase
MRIDNNTAERALRPFTIGRKNWLFAGSMRGGKATATLTTIIQSCRAMGVDPNAYLAIVLKKIQTHPANRIDELLPHNYVAIPIKKYVKWPLHKR